MNIFADAIARMPNNTKAYRLEITKMCFIIVSQVLMHKQLIMMFHKLIFKI